MKIADFIQNLTTELRSAGANSDNSNEGHLLKLESVEIEMTIQIDDESVQDGGFNLQVISASTADKVNSTSIQRVKISLSSLDNELELPPNPPLGSRFSNQ